MRIVMTNYTFYERYISWLTVEVIFMRIVMTNYTFYERYISWPTQSNNIHEDSYDQLYIL